MKKDKFIVQVFGNSFFVASVTTSYHNSSDTNDSHFSFGVFGVEPEDFCCALGSIIDARYNNDTYFNNQQVEIKAASLSDKITFMRFGNQVSINRGGLRVMYFGSVDRLVGLVEAIRKENKKYKKLF